MVLCVGFGDVVSDIPMAALVAVMVMVVGRHLRLALHRTRRPCRRMPAGETTVMVITVAVVGRHPQPRHRRRRRLVTAMVIFARRVAHLADVTAVTDPDGTQRRLRRHRRAVLRLQQRPRHPVRLRHRPRQGRHRPVRRPHLGRLLRRRPRRHRAPSTHAARQDRRDHRPRPQRRPPRTAQRLPAEPLTTATVRAVRCWVRLMVTACRQRRPAVLGRGAGRGHRRRGRGMSGGSASLGRSLSCRCGRVGRGGRAVRSTRRRRWRSSGSARRCGSSSGGGTGTGRRGCRSASDRAAVGPRLRRRWSCGMTWSMSQPRAGRVHHGKTHVRSRRMTCSRIRSGTSYAGVVSWALRSMTGLIVTLVRESAHQSLTWSSRTSRWPSSSRPVGPNTVGSAVEWWRRSGRGGRPRGRRAVVARGVGSAPSARSSAVWVRARSPRAFGAAHVERLGRTRGPSGSRPRGPRRGRGRGRRRCRARPRAAWCRRSARRRRGS